MQFVKGTVVRSRAGHDKGSFFAVISTNGNIAYIVDGKSRTADRPKAKKLIHLSPTKTVLDSATMAANSEIRKSLAVFDSKVRTS